MKYREDGGESMNRSHCANAYQIRESAEVEIAEPERAEEAVRQNQAGLESLVETPTSTLRRLSLRLLQAQDDERRRIARELHDGIGQNLASLKMNLDRLQACDGAERRAHLFSESFHTMEQLT